jgi:hypothetical protein
MDAAQRFSHLIRKNVLQELLGNLFYVSQFPGCLNQLASLGAFNIA